MLDSCGPLSAVADGLAGVVAGAVDAGEDVTGIDAVDADGAAVQPALRTAAAAAATANRSEVEMRILTSLAKEMEATRVYGASLFDSGMLA